MCFWLTSSYLESIRQSRYQMLLLWLARPLAAIAASSAMDLARLSSSHRPSHYWIYLTSKAMARSLSSIILRIFVYHTQTVDGTVIQNQKYVYRGESAPSRDNSPRLRVRWRIWMMISLTKRLSVKQEVHVRLEFLCYYSHRLYFGRKHLRLLRLLLS